MTVPAGQLQRPGGQGFDVSIVITAIRPIGGASNWAGMLLGLASGDASIGFGAPDSPAFRPRR